MRGSKGSVVDSLFPYTRFMRGSKGSVVDSLYPYTQFMGQRITQCDRHRTHRQYYIHISNR